MKIEILDIDSCNKKIKLDIPYQDYQRKVDSSIVNVGQQVSMPGFRKGKIPKSILEKKYGQEVKREVLTQLVSESIAKAIEEKGLRAAGYPTALEINAEEGTDITVSANLEVFPEVPIKDYSGLELEMKIAKVTDEEVDQVIESYRKRGAKKVQVTGRGVQDKDFVKIDFKGSIDGKPFAGDEAKDYVMQVGAKQFVPGFEEELMGMQPQTEKDFQITMPDDHPKKELAGKTVDFHVLLHGIQVEELPALDDAFAQHLEVGDTFTSLADLKEKSRKKLEDNAKFQAKKGVKKQLAEKLAEANALDVPEGLIKQQIRFMIEQKKSNEGQPHTHDHSQEGHSQEESALTPQEEETHREPAIKILQQELVISKLSDDLGIKITEQELNQEIKSISVILGQKNVAQVRQELEKNGTLDRLKSRMIREKTLDAVLDKIKVREEMVDSQEIIADN